MNLFAAFLSAAVAAAPSGDIFFEQTATTSLDGKPGPVTTSRVSWSGRRVRLETGDAFDPLILLLDLERDRAYRLDPARKTAVLLDVEGLRSRAHLGFALAGDRLGSAAGTVRKQNLEGLRTIAGHSCRGYRLRAGDARMDVWMAEGLPVDMDDFTEFLEWSGASEALGALLPELARLPGFPLETRSRVTLDGHLYETRATVTRLKRDGIDPALFAPPPSFRLESEAGDPAP